MVLVNQSGNPMQMENSLAHLLGIRLLRKETSSHFGQQPVKCFCWYKPGKETIDHNFVARHLGTKVELELVEFSETPKDISFLFLLPLWGRVPTTKMKSRWKKGNVTHLILEKQSHNHIRTMPTPSTLQVKEQGQQDKNPKIF
ncbi:hypothetical protein H5410_061488 [Solanum commersonii]|uniref:Uncharacterized protein n=1 Tax=Solanum commersonii TaxID=4109 RepID=A0A9J5W852_SOLCO|nr:hypothetical protein H5410_061488 [Solanum commersonii]